VVPAVRSVLRALPAGGAVDTLLEAGWTLTRAGVVAPMRPERLAGIAAEIWRWGITPATGYAVGAVRHPDAIAIVDDDDLLTFADVHRRSSAVGQGLRDLGVQPEDTVALLARNSADFVVALVGAVKAGADLVYLNTGFSAPQLADVLRDEQVAVVIADAEFADVVTAAADGRRQVYAGQAPAGSVSLAELAAGDGAPSATNRSGRHVILTSGTTGRPRGAPRAAPAGVSGLEPAAALLGRIPLRAGEPTVLAAPMFHAWGFLHLSLAMLLGSTLVLSRRFDPERALGQVQEQSATALAAVPVMLQRILDLPAATRARYDASTLRVVAVSGSALPAELAARFTAEFGPVLYDLYGSTEVAYATVATPEDRASAPGTVGRPLHGVTVRVVDEGGQPQPVGTVGRIFVGNALSFTGYSGGDDKERLDGLVATGDLGYLDDVGRLFVVGRADDLVISGGENVYPGEVEECLRDHPDVLDAAVVGVPDEQFGQRLVAHVVRRPGRQVTADQLRRHVKRALANYKAPRDVVFHESLPRNETGKVLKRDLPAN
jgi:acyl-CoA synthetase (AMP-forming)/AMP-acid ligase II